MAILAMKYKWQVIPVILYNGKDPEWGKRLWGPGCDPAVREVLLRNAGPNILDFTCNLLNTHKTDLVATRGLKTWPALVIMPRIHDLREEDARLLIDSRISTEYAVDPAVILTVSEYVQWSDPEFYENVFHPMDEDMSNRRGIVSIEKWTSDQILEQGIEQGVKKGRLEGVKEGMEKGRRETAREMAERMLKNGYSEREVSKITKIPESDLKKLR